MQQTMRLHWPFAILAAFALWLVLANLGSDYLWEDEGDTAVLASNILKFGVPKAWDGVTFTDADKGARLNDDLIMVSHPWVQYYVAAGSFLLFGENSFTARLPFALFGWLTILLAYFVVWRITANPWAAFVSAALLTLSVQFLLYCRQSRNYSLNMFLTCALIWSFLRMKTARSCALFAVIAILLFHTHPIGIVPVIALGVLTLIYRPFFGQRRYFWFSAPAIAALTLPWLVLARSGYAENTERVEDLEDFLLRFVQYLIECASVTPLIGIVILGVVLACWKGRRHFKSEESGFVVVTAAVLLAYALPMTITQSSNSLFLFGLRYVPSMIPLLAMVAGILIWKISGQRPVALSILFLLFAFSKLAQLTPWTCWADKIGPDAKKFIQAHVPAKLSDAFLNREQFLYLRDLWRDNPGSVGRACDFLRQRAKPGDILIANYGWESLYFHTRLPQGLKILAGYPVYELARRKNLPEYVFSVERARWIVWRLYWEGYQGYRWSDVETAIISKGGRITQVAEATETVWENRENIHARRFSGGIHLYPWASSFPPEGIFRVDWPGDAEAQSSNR